MRIQACFGRLIAAVVAGLCATVVSVHAQDGPVLVHALTENANAVVEWEQKTVRIKSLDKVLVDHHYRIKILNEAGAVYAGVELAYDRFVRIDGLDGSLYDAVGKKIRSLKKNQVSDHAIFTQSDLALDDRVKQHDFNYRTYPYTVEYDIRMEIRGTFFLPSWAPVRGQGLAVVNSTFTVETPARYELRYKAFNYADEPVTSSTAKTRSYQWQLKFFPGTQGEYASPSWQEITPGVMLGPSDFEIEGFAGRMNGWEDFGRFFSMLNKDRDQLPDVVRQEVARIKASAADRRQLVDDLYRYLQKNTRYVSVQLGIGGWRPFPATYVAANGYGDCKALSNYMVALLKEAGVPACYALVRAGSEISDVDQSFPAVQFNHVIVCVPDGKDTTWLECTSQTTAPGYLGDFTGNRHSLLITEAGGRLVRTPVYSMEQNAQVRRLKAVLGNDARLQVTSSSDYLGLRQDDLHGMLSVLSRDKVQEFLQDKLDFATYQVKTFDYNEQRSRIPSVLEQLEFEVANYATITGKRLFINPNIMTRWYRKPSPDKSRQWPVRLGEAFLESDSVSITLPDGYAIESMPPELTIDNELLFYSTSTRLEGNVLQYRRVMKFHGGTLPAGKFGEIVTLFDKVYKADRGKLVLAKVN
ncbi:MAG: DUF3857 domain-containing protein [Chitinophagaceae bacterium]|nr:MAG: DUF3857 domain-containing protein [Chitinophagaceae bacterium]